MKQRNQEIYDQIKGGLIVSCQALEEEPLHSSYIMSRMALAAMLGGAAGIRANTVEDITAIRKTVDLPVIGIIKKEYPGSEVYITPTMKEIDALAACGVSIIAMDATNSRLRPRPDNRNLKEVFEEARLKYPDQLFMADCSNYEEAMYAAGLGFDFVGTTMNGYTDYTKDVQLPNLELMRRLAVECPKPVIAEGGIWQPDQLKAALDAGVFAAVIGGAITRPMQITQRFVDAIKQK